MLLLDYWLHSGVIVRLAVCFIFSIKLQRPWRLTKGNAEMRNMSKKTWKLRVWNHMTEMQKLDYLLTKAGITHEMERRFPENDKNQPEVCGPGALHDGGAIRLQFEINLAHICGMRYAVGTLTGFLIYSR